MITLLDNIEETRNLNPAERLLRSIVTNALLRAIQEKVQHWIQRGKVKAGIDGNENTWYFHRAAAQLMRKGKILLLEHDGSEFMSHEQKATILRSFYLLCLDRLC